MITKVAPEPVNITITPCRIVNILEFDFDLLKSIFLQLSTLQWKNLLSVCSRFKIAIGTAEEFQRLHFATYYIHTFHPSAKMNQLLAEYNKIPSKQLTLKTKTRFIHEWLPLVRENDKGYGFYVSFRTMLDNENYEEAFATAHYLDKESKSSVNNRLIQNYYLDKESKSSVNNRLIQNYLILDKEKGYFKALELTLLFNDAKALELSFLAYIQVGADAIKLPLIPTVDDLKKIHKHPFFIALQTVKGASSIPVPAVGYFFQRIIFRTLIQQNSIEDWQFKKEVARDWLCFIPKQTYLYGLNDIIVSSWDEVYGNMDLLLELKGISKEEYEDFRNS